MKRDDFPPWIKEFLISLVINVVIAGLIYLLTTSLIKTAIALLITLSSVIAVFYLYTIVNVVRNSGLRGIHKDSPDPTPMLKKYFRDSKRVRLLAIRGARMLGTDRSLIKYIISELPKAWKGKIEILLMAPNSKHLRSRAEELGFEPKQFAAECQVSIDTISYLRQKYNTDIELRLYDRKPVVRTIIFDDRALLSYYIGKQGHIPIQYELRGGNNSLLRMINLHYDELWNESTPTEG